MIKVTFAIKNTPIFILNKIEKFECLPDSRLHLQLPPASQRVELLARSNLPFLSRSEILCWLLQY